MPVSFTSKISESESFTPKQQSKKYSRGTFTYWLTHLDLCMLQSAVAKWAWSKRGNNNDNNNNDNNSNDNNNSNNINNDN